MKLQHPSLIRAAGFLAASLLKGLRTTLRVRCDDGPAGPHPTGPGQQRFLYALWHESVLFGSLFGQGKASALISKHADGELAAQMVRHLRLGVIRGSSKRGGSAALRNMLRLCQRTNVVLATDGPRGPRRKVQPGIVYLASKTGLPIIPFGIGYERAWRARSWDRMAIPYPGSLVTIIWGAPFQVPADLDGAALRHYGRLLEDKLNFITENAERWANGLPRLPEVGQPLPRAA